MEQKPLEALDLNRVLALHWLLEEASVTRAARRLGTSQPALSRSLAELRSWFSDPILTRDGRKLVRTALAEALRPRVALAVAALRDVMRQPAPFEARHARGAVRLAGNDYAACMLWAAWNHGVRPSAPLLDLELSSIDRASADDLVRGTLDLVVVAKGVLPSEQRFVRRTWLDDEYVSVVRAGHPLAGRRITLARFAELQHLLVTVGTDARAAVDVLLAQHGLERRVAVRVSSFMLAPMVVQSSDCITTLPSRLVAHWQGLARVHLPTPVPGFTLELAWHPRATADARHRFVRDALFAWANPAQKRRKPAPPATLRAR
jgi:DNA-binding transcriptional LysR family regulator